MRPLVETIRAQELSQVLFCKRTKKIVALYLYSPAMETFF